MFPTPVSYQITPLIYLQQPASTAYYHEMAPQNRCNQSMADRGKNVLGKLQRRLMPGTSPLRGSKLGAPASNASSSSSLDKLAVVRIVYAHCFGRTPFVFRPTWSPLTRRCRTVKLRAGRPERFFSQKYQNQFIS